MQDPRNGSQGDLGPPAGLQPAPRSHGAGGPESGGAATAVEPTRGAPDPRSLSQQGARQTLEAFHSQLGAASPAERENVIHIVLSAIARHRVGTRPDRYEPRVRKHRPKPYPLMTVPRQQARERLARAA